MTAYFVPLIFLSILTSLETLDRDILILKNKYFYYLIAIFFIIFIGLRSDIGCDWERYLQMFDKFSSMNFLDLLKFNYVLGPHRNNSTHIIQEMGHVLITSASRNIYTLNLIYACIFVIPLFYFCSKIKRVYLSLLISYPYYVVVIGMGPIRQAACISLLMVSILLISNRKYINHSILTIFSLLIHQFSIIFNLILLIPIFPKLIKDKISKPVIFLVFILFCVLMYSLPSFIVKLYFYITLPGADVGEAKSAIFIWLINFIPSIIFLFNIPKFDFNNNLNKILFTFSVFEILLLPLVFLKSVIAYRLLLYLYPSSIYITSYIPDLNLFKIRTKDFINILIFLSFITFFIWINFAFHSYCWLPYKNIILN